MANYSTFLTWRTITLDSADIGNFYNTINLINHEGSGHGYQDYAISNKSDYINTHPAQKDDVKILDLSFHGVTIPNLKTIDNYGVYLSDPAEMDAWRMGDTIEKNLKNSKKGN